MNRSADKSVIWRRILFLLCFLIFLALGLWKVCGTLSFEKHGYSYAFDGWVYGREDQKRASRALASSGLNDFHWEEGRLSVPSEKLVAYQSALAAANALPKAPGDQREETMRSMSVFESESKARLRELNGCASQLERTIEQIRGVEFATVGVRSRRVMSGFSSKDVVTASVGVAFQDGKGLDSNTLTAITLATRHHLGIDDAANISIIDLKEGKSYLGVQPGKISEAQTSSLRQKEEIEKYWREKYLEAFHDIKNLRVSVIAELGGTELDEGDISLSANSRSFLEEKRSLDNEASGRREERGSREKILLPERITKGLAGGAEEKFADSENQKRNERTSLRYSNSSIQLVQCTATRIREGNATLGNPVSLERPGVAKRISTKDCAPLTPKEGASTRNTLESSSRFNWLEKRSDSYKPLTSLLDDADVSMSEKTGQFSQSACLLDSNRPKPLVTQKDSVRFNCLKELSPLPSGSNDSDPNPVDLEEKHNPVRQVSALENTRNSSQEEVLRAITICISVPQSYMDNITQKNCAVGGNGSENGAGGNSKKEQEVLDGIKSFAIDLFRPVGESLGWNESTIENSFIVSSFLDTELLSKESSSSSAVDELESSSSILHKDVEDEPFVRTGLLPNTAYVDSLSQSHGMTTSEVSDPYGEKSEQQSLGDNVGEEPELPLEGNNQVLRQKFSIDKYWDHSIVSRALNRVKRSSNFKVVLIFSLILPILFIGGIFWRRRTGTCAERNDRPMQDENLSHRDQKKRCARRSFIPEEPGDFDEQDEYLSANEEANKARQKKDLHNSSVNVVGNGNDAESGSVSDYWNRRQEALESINRKTLIHSN